MREVLSGLAGRMWGLSNTKVFERDDPLVDSSGDK
jgi:hypothetical protein